MLDKEYSQNPRSFEELVILQVKGAVRWYCIDAKPFNLTACFITKCDMNCYDYTLKMAGHGQQCTIMYEL